VTGQWFSQGPLVFSTNKTDCHDIAEILLKVALNTIKQTTNLSQIVITWDNEVRVMVFNATFKNISNELNTGYIGKLMYYTLPKL
jgi:hypothetical protein